MKNVLILTTVLLMAGVANAQSMYVEGSYKGYITDRGEIYIGNSYKGYITDRGEVYIGSSYKGYCEGVKVSKKVIGAIYFFFFRDELGIKIE